MKRVFCEEEIGNRKIDAKKRKMQINFFSLLPDLVLHEVFHHHCNENSGKRKIDNNLKIVIQNVQPLLCVSKQFHRIVMLMLREYFIEYMYYNPTHNFRPFLRLLIGWLVRNNIKPNVVKIFMPGTKVTYIWQLRDRNNFFYTSTITRKK